LPLFDTAIVSLHRAGNVASLAIALAWLAVCFDRFDRPDVAATLYGASTNPNQAHQIIGLPAAVEHLRSVPGDAFDQCAATGAGMDPADAVEHARHQIQLARRQAANPDSGRT
jgi:hypothetical protein